MERSRPGPFSVIIVGGGPVGLLLANLLGAAGVTARLYERRRAPAACSMAIGITPPSLEILALLGLDTAFEREGVCIDRAMVHENGCPVGTLRFDRIPGPYPWLVSLPQARTEFLLRERLEAFPTVRLLAGRRVVEVQQDTHRTRLRFEEEASGRLWSDEADVVVGCDGARSLVRVAAGISGRRKRYRPRFTMLDARDDTGLGEVAHLFFSAERPVESFPLPGGRRRWVVRTGWGDADDLREPLGIAIRRLTGHAIDPHQASEPCRFTPSRMLAASYGRGRLLLCGDAAHVMSPIGGQGMNTGFGDALFLSRALSAALHGQNGLGDAWGGWFSAYNRQRRHAFRMASSRAALGMGLGVLAGRTGSRFRGRLLRAILEHADLHQRAALWFSMLSLPHPLQQASR